MQARITVVCVAFVGSVLAFKDGAPGSVCLSGVPKHKVDPQPLSTNPYKVDVQKEGANYAVTISGAEFKGFLITARKVGDDSIVPGTFSSSAPNVKTVDCKDVGAASGVTHSDNSVKDSVKVTFTPAAGSDDLLYFSATVAKTVHEFWVGIKSPIL
ncbi:putative defense protein Hdd11-like [Varroa jacobsoni]|uniref:Reelin domain-containing protein n=1 Tax=Varroa destructor TaxID=109461 RepID=A0A7M7K0B7_VARDE|nr:putative defense protein Hdd11-like [Varroa destructor]XP_022659568.1 putative defense protein Hdd11-like [Varroa destructor]XP_022686776.1 putative defense protein Hdd11-like [Varroa jacobsoni]